jgi:diguanylate cyclase (GGDEF)-like protein
VTSQQLQTIIFIALVANAALIVVALLSTRVRGRAGDSPALDIKATHDTMLAMAAAGTGAFGKGPGPREEGADVTHSTYTGSSDNGSAPAADGEPEVDTPGAVVDDGPDLEATIVLLDPSTGLESPSAWQHAVAEEVPRLGRYHRSATVMIVELDGFERLTERLGEAAGTRLEVATARTLRSEARASDRCARLGPGRFGILLPETDEIKAINFGERIREQCDRWLEAGEVALRLAIGWAILDPTTGATLAIREAERRLDGERRQPTGTAA